MSAVRRVSSPKGKKTKKTPAIIYPKIADYLVQKGEKQDDCLNTPLLPVNMRLLRTNKRYRKMIENILGYMELSMGKYADYPALKGISGANVGIPFNIAIVATTKGNEIMINPKILAKCGSRVVKSNCGSLRLKEPIEVVRHKIVIVEFNTHVFPKFERIKVKFKGAEAATAQHEIDHNNGIMINSL